VIEQQGVGFENVAPHSAWHSSAHPGRLANAGNWKRCVAWWGRSIRSRWHIRGKIPTRAWTLSAKPCRKIAAAAERQKESAARYIRTHLEGSACRRRIARLKDQLIGAIPGLVFRFLSEPWYCCAEPTRDQFGLHQAPRIRGENARRQAPMAFV